MSVGAYTAGDSVPKTLLAFSGGLDATVLLWRLRECGVNVECAQVDYGQAAREELIRASQLCERAGAKLHRLEAPNLQTLLGHGVEPFAGRRFVVLSLAVSLAVSIEADVVAWAERAERMPRDWALYAHFAVNAGLRGRVGIYAPYAELGRRAIVRIGDLIKAPLRATWSCFRGDAEHCGTCRGCIARQQGFQAAGMPDPTIYAHIEPRLLRLARPYLYGPDHDSAA